MPNKNSMPNHRPAASEVIVITGPTASGKTSAAIQLCRKIKGEIISADSMQIYCGMDIGLAKATEEEQGKVPHHLINICRPGTSFSVAAYQERAVSLIRNIQSKGRVPVVCGGTGQYLSALTKGLQFTQVPVDLTLRDQLYQRAESEGLSALWQALHQVDPEAAVKIAPSDQKRIVRALELYIQTGLNKSEHIRRSREQGPPFVFISYCLTHDRQILYDRINQRVDDMIEQGLADEVKKLIDQQIPVDSTCMQAIGYKEMFAYLHGTQSLETCSDAIKQASRRYAKRQLTWFRRMDRLIWLHDMEPDQAARLIADYRETRLGRRDKSS